MRKVIIFREELLPRSETFIAAQVGALRQTKPVYVGLIPAKNSLPLHHPTVFLSRHSVLPKRYYNLPYKLLGLAPNFHRRVSALNAQIFHAHFAIDATNALPLISHLDIPAVVTLHGYDVTVRDKEFRKSVIGSLYLRHREQMWKKVSVFLCVSKFIRDKAKEAGFPEEKLRLHYIGVDREEATPPARRRESLQCDIADSEDVPDSERTKISGMVLFVGRLVEKKGCEILIRAMSHVRVAHPEAHLLIVGDGPLRPALCELSSQLKVPVRFLGALPPDKVRHWMRRSTVFCVPSVTAANGDSEGFGMVFLEAQACGTPVVGTLHGGIPEAVRDAATGTLVPEGDVRELAGAITRYLVQPQLAAQHGAAGQRWVREHFDLFEQTSRLETIYEEVARRQV